MRLSHYIFIYFSLLAVTVSIINSSIAIHFRALQYKQTVSEAFSKAVDYAVEELKNQIISEYSSLNKDRIYQAFMTILYENLYVIENCVQQSDLKTYVPVFIIILDDEIYIHGLIEQTNDENVLYTDFGWSECIKYQAEDLQEVICTTINGYANKFNNIGDKYGIDYKFILPYDDNSDWERSVTENCIIAFFQGYPIMNGYSIINIYTLGAAAMNKREKYYVTEEDNILYYHRKDCVSVINNEDIMCFESIKECAYHGAYAGSCCFETGCFRGGRR